MARSRRLADAAVVIACLGLLPGLASPDGEGRGGGGRDPHVSELQLLPALAAVLTVVVAVYMLASRAFDGRERAAA